nr:hypothetical protein [[Eubacterium] cellulosolvens]
MVGEYYAIRRRQSGQFLKSNNEYADSIPGAAKSMKHTDKTESEVFRFIFFWKHAKNDGLNSGKQAIQERTVVFEKMAKIFRNCKTQCRCRTATN